MPKKKYHRLSSTAKPTSTAHPSLSSSKASPSAPSKDAAKPSDTPTVNELITHLRITQVSSRNPDHGDQPDNQNQAPALTANPRTVHPSLKPILQIPDTPSPVPRRDMNMNANTNANTNAMAMRARSNNPAPGTGPNGRIRRIPGPPPPRSWLLDGSMHAPRPDSLMSSPGAGGGKVVLRLDRLPGLPADLPKERSLLHMALKSMAERWRWHGEYDGRYLATMPTRLKELVLSYVGVYGHGPGIMVADEDGDGKGKRKSENGSEVGSEDMLRAMFWEERDGGDLGFVDDGHLHDESGVMGIGIVGDNGDVQRLDLGNQIGPGKGGVSLKWLKRWLTMAELLQRQRHLNSKKTKNEEDTSQEITAATSTSSNNKSSSAIMATPAPSPSSWEEEADLDEQQQQFQSTMTLLYPTHRFPSLTHLSLAHPSSPQAASWSDLLSLLSSLNTITHLSLAHWPFPTLTPSCLTTKMLPKIPPGAHQTSTGVSYGGTNFYSVAEDDFSEAASILRRLANSTYCLKWLDLEGCGSWWPALRYEATTTDSSSIPDMDHMLNMSPTSTSRSRPVNSGGGSGSGSRATGPDFNGSWRGLQYLNLSAGYLPTSYLETGCSPLCHRRGHCQPSSHYHTSSSSSSSSNNNNNNNNNNDISTTTNSSSTTAYTPVDAINNPSQPYASWIGARNADEDMAVRLRKYRMQKEVEDFLGLEREARRTADWIRERRREVGGKWIGFGLRRVDGMGSAYGKLGDL